MKNVLIVIGILIVSACSSTRLTTSWTAKDALPNSYKKILVLGVIKENDLELKQRMESHMTDDLRSNGYNAVSALDEYGPKAFEGLDESDALSKIHASGVDAILTIVLLNKQQEKEYIPARIYYSPYISYHNRFWGYYTTIRTRIYEPGYYHQSTSYFWESNFYAMDNGKKLIYSAQTKSFNPSSVSTQAHEYGRLIVNNMIQKGLLLKPAPALADNQR